MANYPGLGTDIELDNYGNFILSATGDLTVVDAERCLIQSVKHRFLTPKGNLFYDPEFGFDVYKYLHSDSDELTKLEFMEEVKEQLRMEPRIREGSENCEILSWNENSIVFKVSFVPIEMTTPVNLVLYANLVDMELILKEEV